MHLRRRRPIVSFQRHLHRDKLFENVLGYRSVHCRQGIIQQADIGISIHGSTKKEEFALEMVWLASWHSLPGQIDSSFLSTTERYTFLANQCSVTEWHQC